MKSFREALLLYAVTDRAWVGKQTFYEQVESALKGGATCLQVREKTLSDKDFLAEALEIKKLCRKYQVPLIINDNVEVAIKCGADGIHVGQEDIEAGKVRQLVGETRILGVSVQTVKQALEAERAGADYLGVGAVFTTTSKLDADTVSHATLKEICNVVSIPVVAIGGIYKHNILELSGTGVDGVALVSAIFSAEDIEAECRELRRLSEMLVKR
ncbi:MAG: thiamine phosphate synthase [Clostridia bacterium]|nr:thiamine phosphate synthase [Clostridia bacterium]